MGMFVHDKNEGLYDDTSLFNTEDEVSCDMINEAKRALKNKPTGSDSYNWLKRQLHICGRQANQILEIINND